MWWYSRVTVYLYYTGFQGMNMSSHFSKNLKLTFNSDPLCLIFNGAPPHPGSSVDCSIVIRA